MGRRYRSPYRRSRRRSGGTDHRGVLAVCALGAIVAVGTHPKAIPAVTQAAGGSHSVHVAHEAQMAGAAGAGVLTRATSGGTLDCPGLEHLWEQAGGSPSTAVLAASVAMAESSGQQAPPSNASSNYNGMTDVGYWQINAGIWPSLATTDPMATPAPPSRSAATEPISHLG